MAILPLSITGLTVDVDGERFELAGRTDVFARVSDFVYVGRDSTVTLHATGGGEVAVPTARCERRLPPRYGPAEDVPVEVRGAGVCTRQVTNFLSPESWPHADRLMAVELLTPDGNWSSYPPHRHDDSPECPVNNEEIYYFRIGGGRRLRAAPPVHVRTATIDDTVTVRDGDVFLVPRGYHGPCIAAPGYPMYYLNVLAGPGGERSMAFCDDPAHHWVRESWAGMATDPRVPMTSHALSGGSIGIGVIGFGWMGQAHSRSYRRIPTLFPERTFDPRLVVCADNVAGPLRRGDVVVRLRGGRATTGGASSSTPTSTSSSSPRRTCSTSSCASPPPRPASTCSARSRSAARPSRRRASVPPRGGAGIITGVGYNYRFVAARACTPAS